VNHSGKGRRRRRRRRRRKKQGETYPNDSQSTLLQTPFLLPHHPPSISPYPSMTDTPHPPLNDPDENPPPEPQAPPNARHRTQRPQRPQRPSIPRPVLEPSIRCPSQSGRVVHDQGPGDRWEVGKGVWERRLWMMMMGVRGGGEARGGLVNVRPGERVCIRDDDVVAVSSCSPPAVITIASDGPGDGDVCITPSAEDLLPREGSPSVAAASSSSSSSSYAASPPRSLPHARVSTARRGSFERGGGFRFCLWWRTCSGCCCCCC
jgi:hypothetical protein